MKKTVFIATTAALTIYASQMNTNADSGPYQVIEKVSSKQPILSGKFVEVQYTDTFLDQSGNTLYTAARQAILPADNGDINTTPVQVKTISNKLATIQVPTSTLSDSISKLSKANNIVQIISVNDEPIKQSSFQSYAGFHFNMTDYQYDTPWNTYDGDRFNAIKVFSQNQPFSDLSSDWSKGAIYSLATDGIVHGVGDGRFAPTDPVTRAAFLKMLGGIAEKKGLDMSFQEDLPSDLDSDGWAKPYANKVKAYVDKKESGVFNRILGVSERLNPEQPITRSEAAQIMSFFIPDTKASMNFSDWDGGYEGSRVASLVDTGVISGVGEGRFDPNSSLTREQMATMIMRLSYVR